MEAKFIECSNIENASIGIYMKLFCVAYILI